MPIVQAKCTNCGGNLEVDSSLEAAICPYCKTPYVVEKAINNYNTYVTNNIKADTVVVNQAADSEFEIFRVTLVKYIGHNSRVIIPDYIQTIGKEAFLNCSFIDSILIPKSVREIHNDAFKGCKIRRFETETAEFSMQKNGVEGIENIIILDGVTSIGKEVFFRCESLISVTIPNSVTSIGEGAFCLCTSLASITIPNSVISIGKGAFNWCSKLKSVIIPENVMNIGPVFIDCKALESITVAKGNRRYHGTGNCLVETASKTLVAGCKNSIIPADGSVTSIGPSAFSGCNGLTSITIPSCVTSIGDDAFHGCVGLMSVTIPNGVLSIGDRAFCSCPNLTSVTIPESVMSIGNFSFGLCINLSNVTMPKNLRYPEDAFKLSSKLPKKYCKDNDSGGCYVATCVYGSYDCPQVWTLRRYRDDTLASTWYGRAFIRTYYAVSPTLVKWFGKTKWFKKMWQGKLDRMVKRLNNEGVADTPYADKKW